MPERSIAPSAKRNSWLLSTVSPLYFNRDLIVVSRHVITYRRMYPKTDLSKPIDVYFDWIDHIAEENAAVEGKEEEEHVSLSGDEEAASVS